MAKITKVSPFAPQKYIEPHKIKGIDFFVGTCGFYKTGKPDILVILCQKECQIAGVFTRSSMASPPVLIGRKNLELTNGKCRAIVVNSGNSLAMTGQAGFDVISQIQDELSSLISCKKEHIYTSSTGVIGQTFEGKKITSQLEKTLKNHADFKQASEAICTTDTFFKMSTATCKINEKEYKISGIAKGSGMVEPNMATILGYIFTDAPISSSVCKDLLIEFNEKSFNSITVDSDSSTSDTVFLISTGDEEITDKNSSSLLDFKKNLLEVMQDLAKQIVSDGEGASKFITIKVCNAKSEKSAKIVAKSIANSPLVKTAIAGEDANWGRIAMATGKTLEPVNLDKFSITLCDVKVYDSGSVCSYSEQELSQKLKEKYINITVNLGVGNFDSTVWTCDLTHEYISINADYRS